jgi:hypothetical protein
MVWKIRDAIWDIQKKGMRGRQRRASPSPDAIFSLGGDKTVAVRSGLSRSGFSGEPPRRIDLMPQKARLMPVSRLAFSKSLPSRKFCFS